MRLLEFGSEEETDGAEQLQPTFTDPADVEKAIHVVDGQPVDVRLTLLLLTDLQDKQKHRRLKLIVKRKTNSQSRSQIRLCWSGLGKLKKSNLILHDAETTNTHTQ